MERSIQADAIQNELNAKAKKRELLTRILPFCGLLFVILFFSIIAADVFLTATNLDNLINQCFQVTIVAVGAAFIYAAGMMDLSVGATSCVSMLVMAYLMRDYQINAFLAMAVGIAIAIVCDYLMSMIHITLRVPILITSMCMMNICSGIASLMTEQSDVYIDYQLYQSFNATWVKVLALLIVISLGYFLFGYTRLGKELKAIGGNETAAKMSGVKRSSMIILAFIVLGACLGLSAFFSLCRTGKVTAASSSSLMSNILVSIVLGGFPLSGGARARFFAPIVGALTITILLNGLTLIGLDGAYGNFAKGLLFIVVVGMTYERTRYVS